MVSPLVLVQSEGVQPVRDRVNRHLVALGQSVRVVLSGLPIGAEPRCGHQHAHSEVGAESFGAGLAAGVVCSGGVPAVDNVFQFVQQRHPLLGDRQGAVDEDVAAAAAWLADAHQSFDGHRGQRVDAHPVKVGDDAFGDGRFGDARGVE